MRGIYLLHVLVVYSFSLLYGIPLYKSCLFTHFPINEHLDYFQLGVTKNNNVINILPNVHQMSTHFCWAHTQEWTCYKPYMYVQLQQKTQSSFPIRSYQFSLPQQYTKACTPAHTVQHCNWYSQVFTSAILLGMNTTSLWFQLAFPRLILRFSTFSCFNGYLEIFFYEYLLKLNLLPIFLLSCPSFSLLICKSLLHILDDLTVGIISYVLQILLPFCDLPFHSLNVSFDEQEFLTFIQSKFTIFFLYS